MDTKKYELTFWGGIPFRYTRWHASAEDAAAEAKRILGLLTNRAAHPAIIYGPTLGKDGISIF